MTYIQVITPNPDIPCTPGWCLQYVRQTYGLPAHFNSATEAWDNSTSQHADWDFPADCWVPVWFSLATEPAGHVALRAPDGGVYSSSDAGTSVPHHHPSLDDLISYYAAGNPLTYLGWTEDVAGSPVIADSSIGYESTTITPEIDMPLTKEEVDWIAGRVAEVIQPMHDVTRSFIPAAILDGPIPYRDPVTGAASDQTTTLKTVLGFNDFQHNATRASLPAAVLNQAFTLPDGTVTNLAGILSAINAKPSGGTVVNQASDPAAVVAAIKAQWNK